MAAPEPRVVLEPRALRMSVEGRVLPLTAIEYTIRSRLESNLPSKSSNLRSIPRVSDRLDVSVGIVSQPSGDTGHYFNVTDASTNRYSSANASVNIKLHVWYDLPSAAEGSPDFRHDELSRCWREIVRQHLRGPGCAVSPAQLRSRRTDLRNHSGTHMTTRLLVIDDDTELTNLLSELLSDDGFQLDTYPSGADAAAKATTGEYALVLLDVMLPELNGLEVLRQLRRTSNMPVILLTARGDDIDRIVGLEMGADDYVPKPFNSRELTARIRAVLRRVAPKAGADRERAILSVDDVSLNPASRTVLQGDQHVDLTTAEFDILRLLLESAGRTVTREVISQQVLGRAFDAYDRSADMHISKLRRKLTPRADGSERVKTIRGVGYIYTLPLNR